ncbi:MAG: 50S ribosomal protein L22 [Proteobacteria bacterium]|nr:MAG: 50S ribosomal protein L22 [Pseudomonadota bacterium]
MRHVRIAPQKARLLVNLIRGKQVDAALKTLQFVPKKGARIVTKLLKSAISNAREAGSDVDALWVSAGYVDSGRTIKRFMPRARGSANAIRKRSSHITVVLGQL